MSLSKRTLGLLALCAFALSAFAAQASAATNGTTAFTCKETGAGGKFTKAHCKAADAGEGKFSHVEIPQGTTTEANWTNEKTGSETTATTPAIIKTAATGIGSVFEFQASGVSGTGTLTNKLAGNGEHFVDGTVSLAFTGVTVTAPAGKGCKVKGGKIETAPLKITTAGQGMKLNFTPVEGTKFLTFTTEGCSIGSLNTEFGVDGSLNGTLDGATLNTTEAETTTEATLTVGTMVVGIGTSITLSARTFGGGGAYTPLSYTTIQT
ncbi:MAG TPA: hypothetical protein VFX45_00980 [Solirubrobacterales bacterium]|nr:hypothetical protein [Solirubrobacterales bacterium]